MDQKELSDLIYKNEVLEIEIQDLKSELLKTDSGALKEENNSLQREIGLLQVRLQERNASQEKLEQRLMETIKLQQAELARKGELMAQQDRQLVKLEAALVEAENLRQVQENSMKESPYSLQELHAKLEKIEQDYADKARECSTKNALVEDLQLQCEQLQLDHDAVIHENESLRRAARAHTAELHSDEVKQLVGAATAKATEKLERQLKDQSAKNASLIARMALLQQENVPGYSRIPPQDAKNRNGSDTRTSRQHTVDSLHLRVNELLSQGIDIPSEIVELIREICDSQDSVDEEMRNQLLIKDIQIHDNENLFRKHIKRLEIENKSLQEALRTATEQASPAPSNVHVDPISHSNGDGYVNCPWCTYQQKNTGGECVMCHTSLV